MLFNSVLDWILAEAIECHVNGVMVDDGCIVADLDYADNITLL